MKPYVLRRVNNYISLDYVVVEESFGGAVRYITATLWTGTGPPVTDGYILPDNLPGGKWPWYEGSKTSLQSALDTIKKSMLTHGATPEAVRMFLAVGELDKKEINVAKDKLGAKGAKTEDAAEKPVKKAPAKAAAKTTEAKGTGRKGNPEALEKARAAQAERSSALKAQKIKALVKLKDITVRAGTFREQMLTDLLSSKTVGEFYEKGAAQDLKYDASCVRFAEEKEYIQLA